MLHDLLHQAQAVLADQQQPPSTGTNHDLWIAVIGAIAPLAGVLIVLIPMLRGRGKKDDNVELIERYERYLYRHKVDPNRILTGNEEESDVRLL